MPVYSGIGNSTKPDYLPANQTVRPGTVLPANETKSAVDKGKDFVKAGEIATEKVSR